MLSTRIQAFLNAGDTVIAEVPAAYPAVHCFVRVRPTPKPGVPREERRYLNSTWSMWEYWDFSFRRFSLRDGWQQDEENYDQYLVEDQNKVAVEPEEFELLLAQWVPSPAAFQHVTESKCPE